MPAKAQPGLSPIAEDSATELSPAQAGRGFRYRSL